MIQGFKIVGKKVQYSVVEEDRDGSKDTGELTKHAMVHPNLQRELDRLAVHWGMVVGFIQPKVVKNVAKPDAWLVDKIRVYGFSWFGGDEGNDGLQIMATLTTPGGYSVSFPTPSQALKRNAVPETRYAYMDEVLAIMEKVEERVDAYLDGTERGKDLEDGGDKAPPAKKEKVTHARIAEPVTSSTPIGAKIPTADAEAQARVAGASFEGSAADYQAEIDKGKKGNGSGKKAPQTPENRAGA